MRLLQCSVCFFWLLSSFANIRREWIYFFSQHILSLDGIFVISWCWQFIFCSTRNNKKCLVTCIKSAVSLSIIYNFHFPVHFIYFFISWIWHDTSATFSPFAGDFVKEEHVKIISRDKLKDCTIFWHDWGPAISWPRDTIWFFGTYKILQWRMFDDILSFLPLRKRTGVWVWGLSLFTQ